MGGPIFKNHTFFFVDTEGLRFLLPNTIPFEIPTPAFATAVLTNVGTLQPAELPLYTKMMNLFANAPGAANATPLTNTPGGACTGLNFAGFNGATQDCFATFNATPSALGKEWILAFKIDQNIGQNDKMFFRYKLDHGVQPTLLDPLSPAFDALSSQPSWDTQFQETHVFSPTKANEFTAALSHYVAQFAQNEAAALSAFPMGMIFGGTNPLGPATGSTGYQWDFPQGRNVTQYQFIDNFSWTRGNHSLKFGANFRRYDVSDHNFFWNNGAAYFDLGACKVNETPCLTADKISALQMFTEGIAGQYRQADNLATYRWLSGVLAFTAWTHGR